MIPAWGEYAGAPLAEALASLRAQDLQARIVVVDNASDPPLADLPGAEVIRSDERLSVGTARNLGLAEVRSPYVMFWDADDLMLPGTLRFLRDRIASEPDAVLIAAAILEGDPPVPHRWPRRWTYPLTRWRRAWAFGHCIWSLFPVTGSALMRSDAARDTAGFADANSGEDWVLGVSLAFRGRVVLEPRPGRLYRREVGSLLQAYGSRAELVKHARAVRVRLRSDPVVPRWVRALLPAIAVLQVVAVRVVRPLAQTARAIRAG